MGLSDQRIARARLLHTAVAIGASENGIAITIPGTDSGLIITLDVTVDESTVADKLDVKVQTKIDGTGDWIDVCHFTQHAGNTAAARYIAKVSANAAQAMFTDGALGAGSIRNLIGDQWRANVTIIDDSGSAAFTFTVSILAI